MVVVARQFYNPVGFYLAGIVDVVGVRRALDDLVVDDPLRVDGRQDRSGMELDPLLRADVDIGAIAEPLQLGNIGKIPSEDAAQYSLVLILR